MSNDKINAQPIENAISVKKSNVDLLSWPWHVFVFFIYPILIVIVQCEIPVFNNIGSLIYRTWPIAMILFLALSLGLRNFRKAALVISCISVFALVVGSSRIPPKLVESDILHVFYFCTPFMKSTFLTWQTLTTVFLLSLIVFFIKKHGVVILTRFVNVFALLLLFSVLFNTVKNERTFYLVRQRNNELKKTFEGHLKHERSKMVVDQSFPDVYLIIPDQFSGLLAFDGSVEESEMKNFVHEMEIRGYKIPKFCLSNYPYTNASLPSMMNMQYLDMLYECIPFGNGFIHDYQKAFHHWNHNTVMLNFVKHGYDTIYVGKPYGASPEKSPYDKVIDTLLPEYQVELQETAKTIMDKIASEKGYLVAGALEALKQLSLSEQTKRPRFIHCHFPSPHSPCAIDEHGNFNSTWGLWTAGAKEHAFVQNQLLKVVDTIKMNSKRNTVIIIVSDHGTTPLVFPSGSWAEQEMTTCEVSLSKDTKYAPYELENEYLNKIGKYGCFMPGYFSFMAIYMDGKDVSAFPDRITNVNLFRYVFNVLFDETNPILPDKIYRDFHSSAASGVGYFDATDLYMEVFREHERRSIEKGKPVPGMSVSPSQSPVNGCNP